MIAFSGNTGQNDAAYIYNETLFFGKEFLTIIIKWMNFEGNMLSEISKTERY